MKVGAQLENCSQSIWDVHPDIRACEHLSEDGDSCVGAAAKTTEEDAFALECAPAVCGFVRLSRAAQSFNTRIPSFAESISLVICSAMEYHS